MDKPLDQANRFIAGGVDVINATALDISAAQALSDAVLAVGIPYEVFASNEEMAIGAT